MDENEYFSGITLENHEMKIIKELSQLQIIFDWKYIELWTNASLIWKCGEQVLLSINY